MKFNPLKATQLVLQDAETLTDTLCECYYDTNIDTDVFLLALFESAKCICHEEEIDFQSLLKCYLKKE